MKYDRNTHGDFRIMFDINLKRNYWILGYFGGGSININDAFELAKDFSQEHNVPLETIYIDEVLNSRRYKHFKVIYSCDYSDNHKEEIPHEKADKFENVWKFLTD